MCALACVCENANCERLFDTNAPFAALFAAITHNQQSLSSSSLMLLCAVVALFLPAHLHQKFVLPLIPVFGKMLSSNFTLARFCSADFCFDLN